MLKDFREQRAAALAPARLSLNPDAFLFSPDPTCLRPWRPDHFTHAYRELTTVLSIAEPLKNLRHFNATQLLAAGVDLRTTAGRLGHTDGGATTLKVYTDWTPAQDLKAVEVLATDLAALRTAQRGASGDAPPLTSAMLPQGARPIEELLEPPVHGRTTYVEVAQALRHALDGGLMPPGVLVPTVTELATRYGIARSTAQRAVSVVANEGRIARSGSRWASCNTDMTLAESGS